MNNNIKNIIIKLIKKIKILNYKYYFLNNSKISDYEYDLLLYKLNKLENKYLIYKFNYSPTFKLDKIIKTNFKKIKHLTPMLSLKSIYNVDELKKFINNVFNKIKEKNIEYCCEYKLDGIAANLIYNNNKLINILTRGNGIYGEDIYKNIKYIYGIPKKISNIFKLPNLFEVRGEICISNKNFFIINKILKKNNKKIFLNQRNTVSGIARNTNDINIYYNKLSFFCYGLVNIIEHDNINYNNQFDILNFLNKIGFKLKNKYIKTNIINKINKFYLQLNNNIEKLKYKIDGIVIKTNLLYIQKKLGLSYKFPNWAISYKFTPKKAITYIENIKYNIVRTGILIPIIKINEIIISNTRINKVYLNLNKIINLNINIGDKIIVKKMGDTIPIIEKIIEKKNKNKIIIPKKCPSCNFLLKNINNNFICFNFYKCKSQIINRIIYFFSKNCIFAYGVGEKTINNISKYIKINSPINLFNIKINELLKIPNIKYKKAFFIKENINKSKKTTLNRFICSLGIKNIGKKESLNLSLKYKNIINLIKNYKNDYINNKLYINKKKFNSLKDFLNNKKNLRFIFKLINYYIIFV